MEKINWSYTVDYIAHFNFVTLTRMKDYLIVSLLDDIYKIYNKKQNASENVLQIIEDSVYRLVNE